ncbi:MAG: hypothetical protein LBP83_03440 [Dysgonamonadaceae bacterium]|jgi:hypothetical protein|nr:hypothetical protein [Dysgonamonadaceae bacterium]
MKTLNGKIIAGLLFFLFVAGSLVKGQHNPEYTTQGTEFWITFGQCTRALNPNGNADINTAPYILYSAVNLGIKIAASQQTTVNYEFVDNPSLNTTFTISAGSIGPPSYMLTDPQRDAVYLSRPYVNANIIPAYNATKTKTLRITTDKPVSVYAVNQNSGAGDATNVLPVNNWGTSYYHISNQSDGTGTITDPEPNKYNYQVRHYDGYAVIANKNGTQIKDNGTQVATLDSGEVYYSYSAQTSDFTGKLITSNYPVAYFVINTGTRVPTTSASTENLFQQMVPINGWGRNFMIPLTHRGKERIKIMSSQPNTNISIQGTYNTITGNLSNMNAGSYVEIEMTSACFVSSNFPVGVCSFMVGNEAISSETDATAGDPSMAWVPSVEQMVYSTTIAPFYMASGQGTIIHYAMIVVPEDSQSSVTMATGNGAAGALSGGSWVSTVAGYSYYEMPLDAALTYTFANPEGLMIIGYGYGGSKSYYYVAGAAARTLNPHIRINDEHYQDVEGYVFCDDDIEIKGRIYSKAAVTPYLWWKVDGNEIVTLRDDTAWNTSDLGLAAGNHTIQMIVQNQNILYDTCTYEFSINPLSIPQNDTSICLEESLQLTANYEGGIWSSDNEDIVTVSSSGLVTTAGTFDGTANIIYTYDQCTDTVKVTVLLVMAIADESSICVGGTTSAGGLPDGGSWSSSDENILTVDVAGTITGVAEGTASVIYSYENCTGSMEISVETCSKVFEVWNWEDLWEAITYVNAGTIDTISLMQNIGTDGTNSGNGIGTGPNGENCPHPEAEKKLGSFGYDDDSYGFLPLFPGAGIGWSCPAITADSFVFEGNGNAINGLYYQGSDSDLLPAFFSSVNKAEFKNLTVTTGSIGFDYTYAVDYAGGFIAHALEEISFENCSFKGYISLTTADQAGGFVGRAEKHVTITNSSVSDSIILDRGNLYGIGGFVGNALDGVTIENSISDIKIKAGAYIGGFVGSTNNDITIIHSTSNATLENITNWSPGPFVGSMDTYSEDYVGGQMGGFVGAVYTDLATTNANGIAIIGCTMNGQLVSNDTNKKLNDNDYKDYIGGIVGYIGGKDEEAATGSNADIKIDSCSMKGSINAPEAHYVGGLVGGIKLATYMGNVTISKSNVISNITAKREAGGFAGTITGEGNIGIGETYFRGNISADSSAGFVALVQQASGSENLLSIENCYAAGSVFGNNVAGFIYQAAGNIALHNDFEAINLTPPGGIFTGKGILFGNVSGAVELQNIFYDNTLAKSAGETISNTGSITGQAAAVPNAEMIEQTTYPAAWFDNTGAWAIVDKETYPYLKWQVTTDLTNAENNYDFEATEYQLENSPDWIKFNRIAELTAAGNYTFRFTAKTGDNAAEAFFPYTTQKISFANPGNTLVLNGFNTLDSIVAYGVSQTGIIGAFYKIICPSGTRLFVNKNIDPASQGDGTTWETPLVELAEALEIAKACPNITEIWVAEGIYYPKYDLLGSMAPTDARDITFSMVSGVNVYGGFPANASTANNNDKDNILHRNWDTRKTILSGDIGTSNDVADNAYHVVMAIGLDTTELNGFTITAGNTDTPETTAPHSGITAPDAGAGLYIDNTPLKLSNLIIAGNKTKSAATGTGGGLYIAYTDQTPSLINVVISGNLAYSGGGVHIVNNENNQSVISSFTNVTIAGNNASSQTGGGLLANDANAQFDNVIIWGNGTNNVSATPPAGLNFTYSLIGGSGGSGQWEATVGTDGGNNIDEDPLFVFLGDALEAPTIAGNYSLTACSPAVEAGTNGTWTSTDVDFSAKPRIWDVANNAAGGTVDMGAYEHNGSNEPPEISNSGNPDICVGSTITLSTVNVGKWTLSAENIVSLTPATGNVNSVVVTGIGAGSGSETVTVSFTDSITNCVNTIDITVHEAIEIAIADKFCFGEQTGTVILTATGGSGADYSYYIKENGNWVENTDEPANEFTLAAGNYEFKVTDSYGCETEMSYPLDAPAVKTTLNITQITRVSCEETSDGSIVVVASNGKGAPYQSSYSSDNGANWTSWGGFETDDTHDTIRNLPSGSYLVKVRDKSECESEATSSLTIDKNSAPVISGCFTSTITKNTDTDRCYASNVYAENDINITGYPLPVVSYALYNLDDDDNLIEPPYHTGNGTGYNHNFETGKTRIVITARNSCDTVKCSFDVIVTDNQSPVISCVVDGEISKLVDGGGNDYTASNGDLDAVALDNCELSELIFSYIIDNGQAVTANTLDGSLFPVGVYDIQWIVIDKAGLTDTCPFTLTVSSNAVPVIVCANNSVISGEAKAGTIITLYKDGTPLTTINPIEADATGKWSVAFTDISGSLALGDEIKATLTENSVESDSSETKTLISLFSCDITDDGGNKVRSVDPHSENTFKTEISQDIQNATYRWSLKPVGSNSLDAVFKNGTDNTQSVIIEAECNPFILELTVNYDGCISQCFDTIVINTIDSPLITAPVCAGSATVSGTSIANVPVKLYRIENLTETLVGETTSDALGAWTIYVTETLTAGDSIIAKAGFCESGISQQVKVSALPDAPTFKDGAIEVCSGEALTVTMLSDWFLDENVNYLIYTDSNGNIPANLPIQTNYEQQQVHNLWAKSQSKETACESSASLRLTIIVHPLPAAPTLKAGADQSVCDGETIDEDLLKTLITYDNTTTAVEFYWDANCTILFDDTVTDYSKETSHSIYAIARDITTGCATTLSSALKIVITVNPLSISVNDITTKDTTICEGNAVELSTMASAVSVTNPVYHWYAGLTETDELSSLSVTPSAGITTYYVAVSGDGLCEGEANATGRDSVVITVNPLPETPMVSGTAPICNSTTLQLSLTLDAAPTGIQYNYYERVAGNEDVSVLGTSTSYNSNATYWAETENTATGCVSAKVEIPVYLVTSPSFVKCQVSDTVYAQSGHNAALFDYFNSIEISGTDTVVTYAYLDESGDTLSSANAYGTGLGFSGFEFPIGKTTVVIKATNACDDAECKFDITVIKTYRLQGTMFPFVYEEGEDTFNELFEVTASLYAVPSEQNDPIDELLASEPLYSVQAINYDGSIFIPSTPKNPGTITSYDNPGLPVSWQYIGGTQGTVDNTPLIQDETPTVPIGLYRLDNVLEGEYVLVLSRPGFISRFAKITVSKDTLLGHRELISGDVDDNLEINAHDISLLNSKKTSYPSANYNSKYDLNGDGHVDQADISIIRGVINAHIGLYQETEEWLKQY